MANQSVGSIHYELGMDTAKFDAAQKGVQSKLGSMGQSFGGIADGLGNIISKLAILAVSSGVGMGAMAAASFDQVRQVENASFALKAYEKDASKVNTVLADLVKFARSDMGVLFQREDLFATAQTLKIFGSETANLTERTKILAKASSVANADMKELGMIVGRAGAAGKLTAVDFDMLLDRGIGLDRSMRGASVSAEQLFQAIDKAIPDSILQGRANTIDGVMIRLQSAFRDLGGAILGVDKDTSTFMAGGLGDRFVKTLDTLRTKLRDPALVETFKKIGTAAAEFGEKAIPAMISGFSWILQNIGSISAAFGSLIAMYAVAKVAAIGFSIAAAVNPFTIIATAIVLLVGALAYLQLKFDVLGKAWAWFNNTLASMKPILDPVMAALNMIWKLFVTSLQPAVAQLQAAFNQLMTALAPYMPALMMLGKLLLGTVVIAIIATIAVMAVLISIAVNVVAAMINAGARIVNFFIGTKDSIMGLWNSMIRAVTGFSLYDAGRNMIQGLNNGLWSGAGQVINTITNICKGALDQVKKFFGIRSPSKVMARQGDYIMQGLGIGLKDGTAAVVSQASASLSRIGSQLTGQGQIDMALAAGQRNSMSSAGQGGTSGGSSTRFGDNNITIGQINNTQDADYLLRRINRNAQLEGMGASPVGVTQ